MLYWMGRDLYEGTQNDEHNVVNYYVSFGKSRKTFTFILIGLFIKETGKPQPLPARLDARASEFSDIAEEFSKEMKRVRLQLNELTL